MKNASFTLRLSANLLAALKRIASERDVSVAWLIRDAIRQTWCRPETSEGEK